MSWIGSDGSSYSWDHTNPPHPHHHPFNKFKLEFSKCNNSLNARKTELSSLQFKSFEFIKSDVWGWGGFVWPLYSYLSSSPRSIDSLSCPQVDIFSMMCMCIYTNIYIYIYICIYVYICREREREM